MQVIIRPRAENDLISLYDNLASQSSDPNAAFEVMWRLRKACLSLKDFPERGVPRDDIQKGLRLLVVERRNLVAYRITEAVEILAIFGAGQNWQSLLEGN